MSEGVTTKGARKGGKGRKLPVRSRKKEEASKEVRRRKEFRAGLIFPVGRIHRYLRKGLYSKRISNAASIYLAAVIEYLSAEILELAGNSAHDHKLKRIRPRDIMFAVENDEEFHKIAHGVIIPDAGVIPHFPKALLHTGQARVEYFKAHHNTPFDDADEGVKEKGSEKLSNKGKRRKIKAKKEAEKEEESEPVDQEESGGELDKTVSDLEDADQTKRALLEKEVREQEEALKAKKNILMRMKSPGTPETVNVSDYSSTVDVGKELDATEEGTTGESEHALEKRKE